MVWAWSAGLVFVVGRHGRRALTVATLFLTIGPAGGAFTRLTDSGLGCPDWPGCYGPPAPRALISAIQQASKPAQQGQSATARPGSKWFTATSPPQWGLDHRLDGFELAYAPSCGRLVTLVGHHHIVGAPKALLGADGHHEAPALDRHGSPIRGHVGCGLVDRPDRVLEFLVLPPHQVADSAYAGMRRPAGLVLLVCAVQMAAGAWVSTNYAVLACDQFPQCQNSWWPPMDRSGLYPVAPLGDGQGAGSLKRALTAIHMTHRLLAAVALAALGWLAWRLRKVPEQGVTALGCGAWCFGRRATGLSNVVLDWPWPRLWGIPWVLL